MRIGGQRVVNNDLPSDSEEEKKLRRAIKSANSKKEKFKRNDRDSTRSRPMDQVVWYYYKRVGHYAIHCPFDAKRQNLIQKQNIDMN